MGKKKILVIDDDALQLRLIEAMLKPNDYDVVVLTNGKNAADFARSQKPDLILLDIMMPEMDGYSVLNLLKKDNTTKGIPVIMVTALGFELNKKLADQLGASGYITKPVDLHNLLEIVKSVLLSPILFNSENRFMQTSPPQSQQEVWPESVFCRHQSGDHLLF